MNAERSSVDDNDEKAWYQDGKTSLFELFILLPSMLLQWFAFTLLVAWDNASNTVMEDWLLKKIAQKKGTRKCSIKSRNVQGTTWNHTNFPSSLRFSGFIYLTGTQDDWSDPTRTELGLFPFSGNQLAISFSKSGIPPFVSKNIFKFKDEMEQVSFP